MSVKLFSEMFTAAKCSTSSAVKYGDINYSYEDMREAIELCASDLYKKGIRPGDRVAIWSYNSENWLISFFAVVRLGGVAVLANYSLPISYLAPLLQDCGVNFVIAGYNRSIIKNANADRELYSLLEIGERSYDIRDTDFRARLAAGETAAELPPEDQDSSRDAVIIFTTGTTSIPKMVRLSQESILADAFGSIRLLGENVLHDVALALPLFHSYGLTVAVAYLMLGRTVCLLENLKPDELVKTVIRFRTANICSVGSMYLGALANPLFAQEAAPIVSLCIVGGGFTAPDHIYRLNKQFPGISFVNGYGQSEASPIISLCHAEDSVDKRARSVGVPLPNIQIKIRSLADDAALPVKEVGEICVKGDTVMNGYLGLPDDAQPVDDEGWLHTADLGYIDEEGYLHLAGRIKEIIIKSGENISPVEIEEALSQCSNVTAVKVLGYQHPTFGEDIAACVVLKPEAQFSEDALKTELKQHLPSFKIPTRIFDFPILPITTTGKIDVPSLRGMMLARLEKN